MSATAVQWISHSETVGHCAQQSSLSPHLTQIMVVQSLTVGVIWDLNRTLKMVIQCLLIGKTIASTWQHRNCKLFIKWKTKLPQQVS